jgi:hypothetical protein
MAPQAKRGVKKNVIDSDVEAEAEALPEAPEVPEAVAF